MNATPVGHRHAVGFFESGSHFTRSIGALQSMSSMAGIASYKNTPASSPLKKARCLYALAKETTPAKRPTTMRLRFDVL